MTISIGSSVILFFGSAISNKKLGALHEGEVQVEPLKCSVTMVFSPTLLMSIKQLSPNDLHWTSSGSSLCPWTSLSKPFFPNECVPSFN